MLSDINWITEPASAGCGFLIGGVKVPEGFSAQAERNGQGEVFKCSEKKN